MKTIVNLLLATMVALAVYAIGYAKGYDDCHNSVKDRANQVWNDPNSFLEATDGVVCEVDYIVFGECQL